MKRALIVDDSFMMREALGDILHQEGFLTSKASGRTEAIEQFVHNEPDIVLLDIIMDDNHLTGVELLKEIKRREPSCVVVMVTSIARDKAIIKECVENGADEYIAKPFSRKGLIQTLRRHTQTKDESEKVLIVEDSAMMRKVIRDIVEGYVSEVYEASGEEEALRVFAETTPRLVFLDIVMDDDRHTGVDALKHIKRTDPSCRVVMVTSLTSQKSIIQECVNLGADEYIGKPFRRADIEAALTRLL